MTIFYDSRTGNVERFIDNLIDDISKINNIASYSFVDVASVVEDHNYSNYTVPYALVTYTTKFGEVPDTTTEFLDKINIKYLKLVASSGNRNWGKNYAKAADLIHDTFSKDVQYSMKFELSGLQEDRKKFLNLISKVISSENTIHVYP